MYDEALAGLAFQFNPVALQPAVAGSSSGNGRSQAERGQSVSGGGRGGAVAPAAASSKSVAFNLKERRPGPAYGSPREERAQQQPQFGAGHASRLGGAVAAAAARADDAARQPQGSAGLARLKLASLARQRAAAQAEGRSAQPSAPPPAAAAASGSATTSNGVAAAAAAQEAALLRGVEGILAGCASKQLDDPAPSVALPEHMLRGLRVLAIPPDAAPAAALAAGPAAARPDAEEGEEEEEGGSYQIGAYRPDNSSSGSTATHEMQAAAGVAGPAAADAAAAAAVGASASASTRVGDECATADSSVSLAAASAAGRGELPRPPATLEEALQSLGLLPHPAAMPAAQAGSTTSARLQAVQVVLAARRQAAATAELLPLVQRLRRVCLHLEFHKGNVQRGRSPRRNGAGSNGGSLAPPPGPWLSGRSSSVDSKHRRSRDGSPGAQLQPRPKAACPTPEASELQAQLLGSLQHKLLLKLGLAVLRVGAAEGRLRQRLLGQAAAQGAADLCRSALRHWHSAAVPSQQQEAAALGLAQLQEQRRQRAQFQAWRQWAGHSEWQRRQLAHGQRVLHRRLLSAALQHWRCYCQQQLVARLLTALAARWQAAWGRRQLFLAWRQSAKRSATLKAALLSRPGGSGSGSGTAQASASGQPQQRLQRLPSQLEALATTAAAFQPVKAFVAEAVQQLGQLQTGLRFGGAGSSSSSSSAAAAWQQEGLEQWRQQRGQQQEPLVGSIESLLALASSPRQQFEQQQEQEQQLAPALLTASGGPPPLPPVEPLAGGEAAGEIGDDAPLAAPAPDPGSPSAPYNPASYASPARLGQQLREQQQLGQSGGPGRAGAGQQAAAGAASVAAAADQAADAVEAELLECQEQGSEELHQQCTQLEQAGAEAEQRAGQQRQACAAAAAETQAAADAMQAAVQQHAGAAAECSRRERQLRQRQQECRGAAAAEAGAKAAAHAAVEVHALAGMGVQRWGKVTEGIAQELAACHRTQQPLVLVRLREARQRLEEQQQEAAAAQLQLPVLQAAAQQAAQRAQQAQQAMLEAQQGLVAAAERRAALQLQLDAAMARHEAAAVAAVAAEQASDAAAQQQRLLAARQQAAAGRLRQAAQQALRKQQQAIQLQQQVRELQLRHSDAVATMLAAGKQQQQQQRRGKLKRRLQVVVEEAGADCGPDSAAASSPAPVQQWRRPPAAAAAAAGVAAPASAAAALAAVGDAVGPLVPLHAPKPCDWSCGSSDWLGSPRSEASAPPPLTVDGAAARFYSHCLLRRALHILRLEAHTTCLALLAASHRWRQRQQAAVLLTWQVHAAESADWLCAASLAFRRRWLLRQWRGVAAERRWQREAEAAADAFARHRLLALALAAWQGCVRHECWRDGVHEAVVRLRMRNVLQSWRRRTRQRRQKAAKQRAALAVYERRLLAAALRQWRWVQHSRALLHRVFSTAAELWQEEVGVRLHQRNYERAWACWDAWQLWVLQAQEQRRQAILWSAAAAFREKELLVAGLLAFHLSVADAREQRRLRLLQADLFAEWRQLAATSARHWEYEAARRHCRRQLLRSALAAWRAAADATAGVLAHFWLRWQVQAPLRQALLAWRQLAAARHEERVLGSMAEIHRERQLKQLGLAAFAANASAPRLASTQRAAEAAAASSMPGRQCMQAGNQQQQQQQRQPQGAGTTGRGLTATIVISHGRGAPAAAERQQKEQLPPPPAAASISRRAAAVVSDWREAAAYWQQRHASYSHQQLQLQHLATMQQPALAGPHTASTLVELCAQWQQP